MLNSLFGILLLFFSLGPFAQAAEVMFEGYYRIDLESKPVGYSVMRYEFDAKAKNFIVTSFTRAKFGDQIVQESYKGKTTDRFEPVTYQYTSIVGDKTKMIDATFKSEIMNLTINDGKTARKETHKIPKGTFLSSFLPYMLLQKKLTLNQAFRYDALAEESGNVYTGKSLIQSKEQRGPYEILRILNNYMREDFVSEMAVVRDPKNPDKFIKGEVFKTNSPVKNLSTHLVSAANLATDGQLVPNKVMISLFGGMPTGKLNMIAAPPSSPASAPLPTGQ